MKIKQLALILAVIILISSCIKETDKTSTKSPSEILDNRDKTIEEIKEQEASITATRGINNTKNTTKKVKSRDQSEDSNILLGKNDWWKPKPNTSWHWQLKGMLDTNYDVELYDLDLFDNSKESIKQLLDRNIKVICYFSAGSYENWRIDKDDFPKEVLGKTLEGWNDERWLDISKIDLLAPIMKARMDLALEKKCTGIEPDNVDGYLNDNGFSLTYYEQLTYNKWLAEEAHKRNLTIGLKNNLNQVQDLVDYFDFALNEECFEYEECEKLLLFIERNKAVFGVEYNLEPEEFCSQANQFNFDWLKMDYDLDGGRVGCR